MSDKRIRVGQVAMTILGIVAAAGFITIAVCAPNALQVLRPFFKNKKYSPKQAVSRSIDSLIRSGLLRRKILKNGDIRIELTRKGEWETFLRGFYKKPQTWDGRWRIVIFDIPNSQTRLRNEFTRGMRLYGFKLIQKSAWIYPYPCPDFIALLKKHLELDDVLYLTVSDMDHVKKWRTEFKV